MCILKWVIVPFMKLYVKEAKGFENIPKEGPAILIANHSSYIDAILVRYFAEWYAGRTPRGIQSKEWLAKGWFRRFVFLTLMKQIPTDGSVVRALEALIRGEALMLFPEGGRSKDGKMQKCTHTGLGVLASSTGAPVIPIGISGTFEWWPRQNMLPKLYSFKKIKMKIGKPITFTGKKSRKSELAFQDKAMKTVAKLAGTRYPK
jgi:1-acyl-sn-glycerol-3-phosphate acyltransferase